MHTNAFYFNKKGQFFHRGGRGGLAKSYSSYIIDLCQKLSIYLIYIWDRRKDNYLTLKNICKVPLPFRHYIQIKSKNIF